MRSAEPRKSISRLTTTFLQDTSTLHWVISQTLLLSLSLHPEGGAGDETTTSARKVGEVEVKVGVVLNFSRARFARKYDTTLPFINF